MCEVIRQAIENEVPLQNASVLEDKIFYIDEVSETFYVVDYFRAYLHGTGRDSPFLLSAQREGLLLLK